ncbi:MAG TPA: hypothetical protein VL972_04605 [Solirubrobacteraceae bacterium]|nr:hypothetical protein [Solirubrobacteraceae bacterium]
MARGAGWRARVYYAEGLTGKEAGTGRERKRPGGWRAAEGIERAREN